jgi:hypothetical protein
LSTSALRISQPARSGIGATLIAASVLATGPRSPPA